MARAWLFKHEAWIVASTFPLSYCVNGALVVGLGAFRLKEQVNLLTLEAQA